MNRAEYNLLKSMFFPTFRRLTLRGKYIFFAVLYGLSTLIIPFATQFLVNSLAVADIWLNTITFMIIITAGLAFSLIFRYSQLLINEFMQREIFVLELERWKEKSIPQNSYYYFEVLTVMKTFSQAFTNLVEIGLILIFGLAVIILFHPAFSGLLLLLGVVIFWVFTSWGRAVETSIRESDRKYDIYYLLRDSSGLEDPTIDEYLKARDQHFWFIKRNKVLVGLTYILAQVIILGLGIYFIQTDQLSVGQLVSAEIILSGIFVSLNKLPKTLEALYDFETSHFKIRRALGEVENE